MIEVKKQTEPVKKRLPDFPEETVKKASGDINKAFHQKVFTLFASGESEVHTLAKRFPHHYDYCMVLFEKDQGPYFLSGKGAERIRLWIGEALHAGGDEIRELYRLWLLDFALFKSECAALDAADLGRLSDAELYDAFFRFYRTYTMAGALGYVADALISQGESDWLGDFVRGELSAFGITENEITVGLPVLIQPQYQSFALEAEWGLVRLGADIEALFGEIPALPRIEKEAPALWQALVDYAKRFHWIENNYFTVEVRDAGFFYKELQYKSAELEGTGKTFRELAEAYDRERGESRERQQALIARLELGAKQNSLLESVWLFAEWKDRRKQTVLMGMHYFDRFFAAVAARTGYEKSDMGFLVFPEIRPLLLEKKDMRRLIEARKMRTFYAITPDGYFTAEGHDADRFFRHFSHEGDESVSELRGVPACKGTVEGTVRIVRTKADMEAFRAGEILVTNQTTPEFVPIMKRAGAIVAEQGGITSHAAVISRELGVPCVIGIKTATRILQTGDKVQVDATNGIVKKIS